MLIPATFGLLVSNDAGQTFNWVSEDTVGFGGVYDPDYAIGDQGEIYATTFDGLKRSTDGAKSFQTMSFFAPDAPTVPLETIWVSQVEVANDGAVWATTSTGGEPNGVYRSTNGTDFFSAGLFDQIAWWRSIKVAPNNAQVAYVSGFVVGQNGNPSKATLFKTVDNGQNWTELSTLGFEFGSQPNLVIEGVDPNNSEIVYVRSAFSLDNSGDSIFRSADGGQSFTKVLQATCTLQAFTIGQDSSVHVGSVTPCAGPCELSSEDELGCVESSATGLADSFVSRPNPPGMNCVGESPHDNNLYSCGNAFGPEEFILGQSSDNGQSWTKFMDNANIVGPLDCLDPSCEDNWMATCEFIGKCDEGTGSGGDDAGGDTDTGSGGDDDSSGFCNSSSGGWSLALVLGAFMVFLRRRKRI